MELPPISVLQPKAKKPAAQRLTRPGTAVLQDFWNRNLRLPTDTEETELLQHIQISGHNNQFNKTKLRAWFKKRRKQLLESNANAASVSHISGLNSPAPTISPTSPNAPFYASMSPGASTSSNAAYPTLTPEKIHMLATLYEPLPDPSMAVMQSWAKLLQANEHDVFSWIQEERAKKYDIRTGVNHLPTPFCSTSPEPFSASRGFTPLKAEPTAYPVIPAFPPALTLPRPPRRSDFVRKQTPAAPIPPTDPIMPFLRDRLAQSTTTLPYQTTLLPPPQSVNEFNKRFSPYEEKMKQMMQKFEGETPARRDAEQAPGPGMHLT